MEETVYVPYVTSRDVYVDGTLMGKTNQLITVQTGTHTFDLGEPKSYTPPSVTATVTGTTPLSPWVIQFQPEL